MAMCPMVGACGWYISGEGLVLFVWMHMFFESSILLGKDAMYRVTKMFEDGVRHA